MKVIDDFLNKIMRILVIISFSIMVVVTFMQIVYRYVLLKPIPWAEELARFLFVWITFLGASVAVRNKSHVGVGIVVDKFPNKIRKVVLCMAYIICAVFCALISAKGFTMLKRVSTQKSAAMAMPMSLPYFAIPIGFALMILNFAYLAYEEITEKYETDDSTIEELIKQE